MEDCEAPFGQKSRVDFTSSSPRRSTLSFVVIVVVVIIIIIIKLWIYCLWKGEMDLPTAKLLED